MARNPKSAEIKKVHGDRHKKAPTPKPSPEQPQCPDWFDRETQAHWEATVQNLSEMGILSRTDTDSLIIYCECWQRYRNAEDSSERYKNLEICRRLQTEFGLTPYSRTKIGVTTNKPDIGDWGDILG